MATPKLMTREVAFRYWREYRKDDLHDLLLDASPFVVQVRSDHGWIEPFDSKATYCLAFRGKPYLMGKLRFGFLPPDIAHSEEEDYSEYCQRWEELEKKGNEEALMQLPSPSWPEIQVWFEDQNIEERIKNYKKSNTWFTKEGVMPITGKSWSFGQFTQIRVGTLYELEAEVTKPGAIYIPKNVYLGTISESPVKIDHVLARSNQ